MKHNFFSLGNLYQTVFKQAEVLKHISQIKEEIVSEVKIRLSVWPVAAHLEHLYLTSRTSLLLIEKALTNPDAEGQALNDLGQLLFHRGSFPRGETKAPDFAVPRGVSVKKLRSYMDRYVGYVSDLHSRLEEMESCSGASAHPALGFFTPKDWLNFVQIHQAHHLKIIEELLGTVLPSTELNQVETLAIESAH